MKALIINNKNTKSLEKLIESLRSNAFGQLEISVFDKTGKINKTEGLKLKSEGPLKKWIIDEIDNEKDGLSMIIDENKLCLEPFDISSIEMTMKNQEIFCFSLALGKNITFCSNMNCENILKIDGEENGIITWDWSLHYMDFGYPLNLDGTIFRNRELSKLVKSVSFDDSIELESALQIFDNYPLTKMAAFSESKMIEVFFEKPELWHIFDKEKLEKNRIKYQISEGNENAYKISN